MPLNKPKITPKGKTSKEKKDAKLEVKTPKITSKIDAEIFTLKAPAYSATSKTKKLEEKIRQLESRLSRMDVNIEKLMNVKSKIPTDTKLLEECAIRFRDLTSWQRFSNKTAMGRKIRELLERIDNL